MVTTPPYTFYEFFAGGGMARLGLGPRWRCGLANDNDPMKAAAYRANFGGEDLIEGDVWDLAPDAATARTARADLAWASFPCQDLSLAGRRAGLGGERSGAFFGFWRLIEALAREGRAPRVLVLENVSGALTSNGGADFVGLARLMTQSGWRLGALELDAGDFLPQSRPRLFVVAIAADAPSPSARAAQFDTAPPPAYGCTKAVRAAFARLPAETAARWFWPNLPAPPARALDLVDIIERDPPQIAWRSDEDTERLIAQMAPRHVEAVRDALAAGELRVGAVYRRTRTEGGARVVRAEARFDGLAGCLRTPAGGSSRQFLLVAENGRARSRLIRPREAARLMGLPESYALPARETAALTVLGDGLAVPVVRWLAAHLLEPLIDAARAREGREGPGGRAVEAQANTTVF